MDVRRRELASRGVSGFEHGSEQVAANTSRELSAAELKQRLAGAEQQVRELQEELSRTREELTPERSGCSTSNTSNKSVLSSIREHAWAAFAEMIA